MIDRKLLDNHPANRLAVAYLRQLRQAPDGQTLPLLLLVQAWLDLPEQRNLWELKDMAYQLNQDEPDWVASLFVEDRESLQNSLNETPDGEEWPVFKGALDSLFQAMKHKSVDDVARLLAENLNDNLQVVFPDFGPPNR